MAPSSSVPRSVSAERGWYEGLGAMARVGTGVIIDEVFLDGGKSQARLRIALEGLSVVWVGVRCQAAVAEAPRAPAVGPEHRVGSRPGGACARGVGYDVVVDTSATAPDECALAIVAWLTDHDS